MKSYIPRFFVWSSGILLILTGFAKIISSFGHMPILQVPTPILYFSYQRVFFFVGLCELIIALICLCGTRIFFNVGLVAWLATCFLIYQLGLFIGHYQKPCPCLGSITDTLHIRAQTAETAMKITLAYLFIGSYAILYWLWCQKRKAGAGKQKNEVKTETMVGS